MCARMDIHTAQAARVLIATAVGVVGTCSNVHMFTCRCVLCVCRVCDWM